MAENAQVQRTGNKWLALLAVTLAFTFTFVSRYIWSPLMSDVTAEFGITAVQAGLYMSAFFAGYLITQIPGGIMADKLQPKVILIVCTLLGGVMTALMSTITGYEAGLFFRIVTGVSSGCVMASCSKVVALNFAPRERASAMGILLASPPIGITLANSLGAPLNAALGWGNTFLAVSLVAVVVVLCLLLFVKPAPKVSAPAGGPAKAGMLEGLKVFFTDKEQLLLGIGGFMFMFVSVGFATWANTYAGTLGFTKAEGGLIITCYSVAGIIGSCVSGSLAQKMKMNHKSFLLFSLTGMGVLTLLFSFQRGYTGLILVGIIYGAFSYLPSTHFTTLAMQRAGDRYSATAVSTQNLIFQTSSMIQPAIVGAVIDATGNYSLIWYTFLGCLVLAVVFSALIQKD